MFQSPEFYTNLYTSPEAENLKPIGVALEAVKLMQNSDRYEAALCREMLTSMIREMHIRENQLGVTNDPMRGINMMFAPPF